MLNMKSFAFGVVTTLAVVGTASVFMEPVSAESGEWHWVDYGKHMQEKPNPADAVIKELQANCNNADFALYVPDLKSVFVHIKK